MERWRGMELQKVRKCKKNLNLNFFKGLEFWVLHESQREESSRL